MYSVTCGSTTVFYIRPLSTCIANVDLLLSSADKLAFSGDFLALPSDMSGEGELVIFSEACGVLSGPMTYSAKTPKMADN